MKLTRLQVEALKRVYDRHPLPVTYLQFRRSVAPGYGCVMVGWAGMILGIETDGYTHS